IRRAARISSPRWASTPRARATIPTRSRCRGSTRSTWRRSFRAIGDRDSPRGRINSAAQRGLDRGDVDLLHGHHRLERALGFIAAGCHRFGQHARRDLPRHAPFVLAPATRALLTAIADDGIPIAVGLGLILGGDHERKGLAMLELRTAVEADT